MAARTEESAIVMTPEHFLDDEDSIDPNQQRDARIAGAFASVEMSAARRT